MRVDAGRLPVGALFGGICNRYYVIPVNWLGNGMSREQLPHGLCWAEWDLYISAEHKKGVPRGLCLAELESYVSDEESIFNAKKVEQANERAESNREGLSNVAEVPPVLY